jgi:hypothetical protein
VNAPASSIQIAAPGKPPCPKMSKRGWDLIADDELPDMQVIIALDLANLNLSSPGRARRPKIKPHPGSPVIKQEPTSPPDSSPAGTELEPGSPVIKEEPVSSSSSSSSSSDSTGGNYLEYLNDIELEGVKWMERSKYWDGMAGV